MLLEALLECDLHVFNAMLFDLISGMLLLEKLFILGFLSILADERLRATSLKKALSRGICQRLIVPEDGHAWVPQVLLQLELSPVPI